MSTRRATDARRSIDARGDDEDVDMKDGSDADLDADADGESEPEGGRGMLQIIQDLTTYLCSIEEEYGLLH